MEEKLRKLVSRFLISYGWLHTLNIKLIRSSVLMGSRAIWTKHTDSRSIVTLLVWAFLLLISQSNYMYVRIRVLAYVLAMSL